MRKVGFLLVLVVALGMMGVLASCIASKPKLDQSVAASYIGKHLLIGITYLDHNDNFLEQKQFHGIIDRINDTEGVVVRLYHSGTEFMLPPDLRGFKEAAKGEYRLRSTGEIVVDPDLIANWIINKPRPKNDGEKES